MAKYQPIYGEIQDRARIPWSFVTIFAVILVGIIASLAVAAIFIGIGFTTGGLADVSELREFVKTQTFVSGPLELALPTAMVILCAVFWVRIIENRSFASMGFSKHGWLARYLGGFVVGALFLLTILGIIYAAGGYTVVSIFPVAASTAPVFPALILAAYLIGFLVQGASEEVVFRGWWMSALAARRGKAIALVVTSIFFGLAHMGNVNPPTMESMIGVANVMLFGLFIGLYALKEGSIWGVCGWHSAWNWLLGLGFGLEVSGQGIDATPLLVDLADAEGASTFLTGGGFGPEASFVTTAVLLAGCGWFVMRGALRKE